MREGTEHVVGPPYLINCYETMLFKNIRTARENVVQHHHVQTINEP